MFPSFVFDVNGICREIMRENSEDSKERGRRDPFERIAWLRRRRRRRRRRRQRLVLASSARTKAKGGDLFIGVTHVGDDAANSRTDFARRDLRFRRVFAKPRREMNYSVA